ncbi:MAG: ion transporter [Halobacteriota archaeon]
MQTIQQHALSLTEKEQILYNILPAYFRTKPLEELVDAKDRSKRSLQLMYIALAGAECSSCVSISEYLSCVSGSSCLCTIPLASEYTKDNRAMSAGLKARTYNLFDNRSHTTTGLAIEAFFVVLITLNVLIVIFETVASVKARYAELFVTIELVSLAIFSVEYVTRLWCCTADDRYKDPLKGRLLYVITPLALIDLVAILPTYLTWLILPIGVDFLFIRALRLFRVFRVFKLGHYHDSLQTIERVIRVKSGELFVVAFTAAIILIVASSAMYYVEFDAQPQTFADIPHAMWWGVETLTTIGYGDIVPVTPLGKVLGAVIALTGVALFALPAGILGSGFFEEVQRKRDAKDARTYRLSHGKSVADEIQKAVVLRDAGELTQDEFERYKKQLLE